MMSNVLGLMVGVVIFLAGVFLLINWWTLFIKALMAVVPILLVLAGAGIFVYFMSEIKSKSEMGKEELPPSGEKIL